MNKSTKNKAEINVKTSINTDVIEQNIYTYGDAGAPLLTNTGIERDGGVTNIRKTETPLLQGSNIITEDASVINFLDGIVKVDGQTIGAISPYGVELQTELSGWDDVVLTADNKLLGVNVTTTALKIVEMTLDGVETRQRTTAFSNLAAAYQYYTSLSFTRYDGIKFDDVLEFCLRLGTAVIIMNEGTPDQGLEKMNLSTDVLGTSNVTAMAAYGQWLLVGGAGGRIGSFDGNAWRNYNGSGDGLGPNNNATVVGASDITKMIEHQGVLVVFGKAGRIGCLSGLNWIPYTTAGTGLWNNATVVGTDDITAIKVVDNAIYIGGSAGKLGSWTGTAWNVYTSATGVANNATLLGAVAINAIEIVDQQVMVFGGSGRVGAMLPNFKIWTSYNTQFTGHYFSNYVEDFYTFNDTGLAIIGEGGSDSSSATGRIATSSNGKDWTSLIPAGMTGQASYVGYAGGRWFVKGSTAGHFSSSIDGINWIDNTATGFTGSVNTLYAGVPAVYYNDGQYILQVSTLKKFLTSSDGINWTLREIADFSSSVKVWGHYFGKWWITDNKAGKIASSSDLVNWTVQIIPGVGTGMMNFLGYHFGVMLANDGTTSTICKLIATTDGVSWNVQTIAGASAGATSALATFDAYITSGEYSSFYNNVWVFHLRTSAGQLIHSTNGLNWTLVTLGTGLASHRSVCTKNGLWFALSNSYNVCARSTDGINWTATSMPFIYGTAEGDFDAYEDGIIVVDETGYVSGRTSNRICWSKDGGATWEYRAFAYPAGGGGCDFAGYLKGCFMFTWNFSMSPPTVQKYSYTIDGFASWVDINVPAGGGVAGKSALIYKLSPNLMGMTSSYSPTQVWTSPDGVTWTAHTSGFGGTFSRGLLNENRRGTVTASTQSINCYMNGYITFYEYGVSSPKIWTAPESAYDVYAYNSTMKNALVSNGGVIGSENINTTLDIGDDILVGGNAGRIGSFRKSTLAWTAYNGTGVCDNATLIGSSNIYQMKMFDGYVVVAGGTGRIGSWKDSVKYVYSGTEAIHADTQAVGTADIFALLDYTDRLYVGAANSIITTMNLDYTWAQFWTYGSEAKANLLEGFNSFNYVYCFRYTNGRYLINLVGNTNNISYDIDKVAKTYYTMRARYCIPQTSGGQTRHIITGTPQYFADRIESIGLHGYTDFITYSPTAVYPIAAIASIASVGATNVGWGCTDHTYTIGSAIYNWSPLYRATMNALYQVNQSNTDVAINAYGKLNNNFNMSPTKPFEFRIGWINGTQSFLSVARIEGAFDTLGTMLTGVGEFDDTYTPQLQSDDTILYKYDNNHIIKKIGVDCSDRLYQIEANIYKINTISPYNIVDLTNKTLAIGSSDYNGRVLLTNTTATAVTATKMANVFERKYSSSIDVGDKLPRITGLSYANIEAIGYKIVDTGQFSDRFTLDTYINDVYAFSTFADGSEFIDSDKSNVVYIQSTVLPVPIGSQYENDTAKTLSSTLLLNPIFDGYQIGNEIEGDYTLFDLYGESYTTDNKNIYLVKQTNGVYSGLVKAADSLGLKYIAKSPLTSYFYSSFDNSIYTFDGGRSVNKIKRLTNFSPFVKGVYSTLDNTLLLESEDEFVWMRDNVWTANDKTSNEQDVKFANTSDGLAIYNNSYSWSWNYNQGDVVPLVWRSCFLGANENEKSILSEYVYTIFNEDKKKMTIQGAIYSFDESDNYHKEDMRWEIDSPDYSTEGYCKLRAIPEKYRPLASSLELTFNEKVVLIEVVAQFTDSSNAKIESKKTR